MKFFIGKETEAKTDYEAYASFNVMRITDHAHPERERENSNANRNVFDHAEISFLIFC